MDQNVLIPRTKLTGMEVMDVRVCIVVLLQRALDVFIVHIKLTNAKESME